MPKRGWEIPEREATPEDVYMNRRKFMVAAGGALGALAGCGHEKIFTPLKEHPLRRLRSLRPRLSRQLRIRNLSHRQLRIRHRQIRHSRRSRFTPPGLNEQFKELDRPLTDEAIAGSYNNFYEFSTGKTQVKPLSENFITDSLESGNQRRGPPGKDVRFWRSGPRYSAGRTALPLAVCRGVVYGDTVDRFSDESPHRFGTTAFYGKVRQNDHLPGSESGSWTAQRSPLSLALCRRVDDGRSDKRTRFYSHGDLRSRNAQPARSTHPSGRALEIRL